jgi:hypothetical protein
MDEIAPMLDAEQIEIVESLLEDATAIVDVQRTIDDSLAKLEVRDLEDRIVELDRLIPLASKSERDGWRWSDKSWWRRCGLQAKCHSRRSGEAAHADKRR